MDKIIVYVDDAEYALQQLAPMESNPPGQRQPIHWILVACAPRMTRYASQWVNQTAREKWRGRWSEKVFSRIVPGLLAHGDQVTPLLARGRLMDLTRELMQKQGAARVMDARRPKLGQDMMPVTVDQPTGKDAGWTLMGGVAGMGAILILASE